MARRRIEMLHQSAAVLHIQDLESPADSEQWKIAVEELLNERALQFVARIVGRVRLGLTNFAVERGVHVGTTHEDEPGHIGWYFSTRSNQNGLDARIPQRLFVRSRVIRGPMVR